MKEMNKVFYPVFQERQTLSHFDLNYSFDYLKEQDLLTRANLIGTGIVRGLTATIEGDKLKISAGCGVTSDGHYITLDNNITYSFYREFDCDCFCNTSTQNQISWKNVVELSKDNVGKQYGDIKKEIFVDKLVVLFCEVALIESVGNDCSGLSDSESGAKIKIRPLLVPKDVFSEGDSLLKGTSDTFSHLSPLPRLDIGNDFANIFKNAIGNRLTNIDKAISDAYAVFETILAEGKPSNPSEKISPELKQNDYDFLCDLIDAYNEFFQCGKKVMRIYSSSKKNFPCHLILGEGKDNPYKTDVYRHYFRPATASDDYAELNWLWDRLVLMIEYFNATPSPPPAIQDSNGQPIQQSAIRLTPSVYGTLPLSNKAVPYYYNKGTTPEKALPYNIWINREGNEENIGYWYENGDAPKKYYGYYHEDNWKNYDLERYNFVRIEGHLGVENDKAINSIKKAINTFRLPVEIITLSKGKDRAEECVSVYSKYQESCFVVLYKEADSAVSVIAAVANTIMTQELETDTVAEAIRAADEEVTAADTLPKAKEAAKKAADAANTVVSAVKATGTVMTVMSTVAEAVEAAENAATAAENAAANNTITLPKAKKAAKAAVKAANTVIKEVEAAKNTAKTTKQAAEQTVGAIGTLASYLKLETTIRDSFISNYSIIVSFVSGLNLDEQKITCGEIIFFLRWIDTVRTTYQQCIEKSFEHFVVKHPGIQHKSGVLIGGTFIIVYDGEGEEKKVIADFCLPYRVTQPD